MKTRFYGRIALVCLLFNIVGFAPSFYLKPVFQPDVELPLRTYVHGVFYSLWFILFYVQTSLVSRRKVNLHRTFGMIGAGLAAVMFLSGFYMIYERALEVSSGSSLGGTSGVVWGNVGFLIAFGAFSALGIIYRRRTDWHRRLMLLATMSMMGQSIGRVFDRPELLGFGGPWTAPLSILTLVAFLVVVALHDRRTMSRIHPVNRWGLPLAFGSAPFGFMFAGTEIAHDVIRWLNGV